MKKYRLLIAAIVMATSMSLRVNASDNIKWYAEALPCSSWSLFELDLLKSDEKASIYYSNKRIFPGYDMDVFKHTYACILERIDHQTGKDTALNVVSFMELGQRRHVECFKVIDGDPHVFSVLYNKNNNTLDVYVQSIDLDNFCHREDVRCISSIKCEDDKFRVFNLAVNVEAMHGHVLVRYAFIDGKSQRFVFDIFNAAFHKVWTKATYTPVAVGINYESDYTLNARGDVYAIQSNYPTNKKDFSKLENRTPYLVCYAKDQSKPIGKMLALAGGRKVVGETISIDRDGNVVCAGLYAEPKTRSARGAFTVIFSPDLSTIVQQHEVAFDKPFFLKGVPDKKQAALSKALDKKKDFDHDYQYYVEPLHVRKDGGFDVVIEKQKIKSEHAVKMNINTGHSWYSDVIVLRCEADGTFRWYNKIPKEQYLWNHYEMLGRYAKTYGKDDKLTFLYNQTDMSPNSIMVKLGKSAKTFMVTFDKDGNETVREIINDPALSNTLVLRHSLVEADGTVKVVKCNQFEATLKDFSKCPTIQFGELTLP